VRFTENKVIRNSILSDILADSERTGERLPVFSEASCPRLQAPAAGLIETACIDG